MGKVAEARSCDGKTVVAGSGSSALEGEEASDVKGCMASFVPTDIYRYRCIFGPEHKEDTLIGLVVVVVGGHIPANSTFNMKLARLSVETVYVAEVEVVCAGSRDVN